MVLRIMDLNSLTMRKVKVDMSGFDFRRKMPDKSRHDCTSFTVSCY